MKKLMKILVMLGILLSMLTQIVQAAGFKFNTIPNATKVKKGDIVKIDLKLSEIDVGKEGINTFECMLKYDEQIFEDVKVESKNNWSVIYNNQKDNENYGKMLAVLLSTGVKEDQEIGTVILKVKEDANVKSGNITFTKASSSDGKKIIQTSDKKVTINIDVNSLNNAKEINHNTSIGTKNSYEGAKIAKDSKSQIGNYIYYIIAFACVTLIATFTIIKLIKRNKK